MGDDRLSTRRTSIIGWSTALAALIALLALAFRLNGLGYVRQNLDRAYPHGLGVAIREAIADGRFDQLPATSVQARDRKSVV